MAVESSIPWPRVAGFIRLLTHDIRNDLNGIDLEAAFLGEMVGDPKAAESVDQLRGQIRIAAARLRELSIKLADPQPNRASLSAQELFLIWQDEAKSLNFSGKMFWEETLGAECVNVDASGVAKAMRELLVNAIHFGTTNLSAMAKIKSGQVVFELRESKPAPINPAEWGTIPFLSTKRGGYGLGLWEADRLVQASGGKVEREILQDGALVTQFKFPQE